MIGTILSWLNPLSPIVDALADAYRAKLNAKNDAERVEADKQIAFFQDQMALARSAAEHDKWWSPRTVMAYCAALYVGKIVVYDTVLGWGFTPNPGDQVTGIVMLIVAFYFGSKALGDIAARLLGRR